MQQIRANVRGIDWAFIRGSSFNSLGIAIARVLGFAFSFVVAHAYSTDEYGRVTYIITLASVVAVLSQPFGQHVIAYLIGTHRDDAEARQGVLATAWTIWLIILVLTMLISTPILLYTGRFSYELFAVYLGISLFYTYYGVSSGFLASNHLLVAYLGSNVVQIVLVIFVVNILHAQSATPAIVIYGLSYIVPLAILNFFYPLPLRFSLGFTLAATRRILRFSAPIWIAHLLYMVYLSSDILMLEHFVDDSAVGVYGLTKTLSSAFHFIPGGITMILMPKIAGMPKEGHRSILTLSLFVTSAVNGIGGALYLLLYQWFIITFFGAQYFVGMNFAWMMALAAILMGIHGVMTSFFVGAGRTSVQVASRVLMMVTIVGVGFSQIPTMGVMGAALANLASSIVGVLFYAFVLTFRGTAKRHVEMNLDANSPPEG